MLNINPPEAKTADLYYILMGRGGKCSCIFCNIMVNSAGRHIENCFNEML
ncbi:hypothetical protein DCCM_4868 [Desulfocucumis palustris]|uniref:Uncharacterized protein n=1 Tax=Desulfocucumis palustris TaxID=1898651 RepID=A0A2L2XIC5_9FIRM|nr:hypothetical protein DCCM_4868 [Desulfocucumis palustris]